MVVCRHTLFVASAFAFLLRLANAGLLRVGTPLSWAQAQPYLNYVRLHGVRQFINAYNKVKDIRNDELKWGDEVEYGIFVMDSEKKQAKLSLRAAEILRELSAREQEHEYRCEGCQWHPEYGAWMIEGTPKRPYRGFTTDLLRVERNMRLRRKRLLAVLRPNEIAPTVTNFPLLGVGQCTELPAPTAGPVARSEYLSDAVINPHPRFAALTCNIRERRGSKVDIRVPLFRDAQTPEFSAVKKLPAAVVNGYVAPPVQATAAKAEALGGGGAAAAADAASAAGATAAGTAVRTVFLAGGDTAAEATAAAVGATMAGGGVGPPSSAATVTATAMATLASAAASEAPYIHMDAMAFGMGCCCLQLTFQARDIDESRYMYDQLAVLSPIMLALSAATPIFRGRLADTDVRWDVIAGSVDDRTPAERGVAGGQQAAATGAAASATVAAGAGAAGGDGHAAVDRTAAGAAAGAEYNPNMAGGGVRRLPKSRYGSISTYIYQCRNGRGPNRGLLPSKYNDIDCPTDAEALDVLLGAGVDESLARHIAHLFTRDPLVIFDGRVHELDDLMEVEHFENVQSTNWQTVRWKPPPPRLEPNDPHIGWRTEFRSLEVQLSDFENAALVVFMVLVTRVILAFDLSLYTPLSKVDDNMRRAHARGAVLDGTFWFRKSVDPPPFEPEGDGEYQACSCETPDDAVEEMAILEILMGKGKFPGLIPLVYAYLEYIQADAATVSKVERYLEHLRRRASGETMTVAAWVRQFVRTHPDYRQDSVVTDTIAHDLLLVCRDIGEGRRPCPELLGPETVQRVNPEDAFDVPLRSGRIGRQSRNELIDRFVYRARGRAVAGRKPASSVAGAAGAGEAGAKKGAAAAGAAAAAAVTAAEKMRASAVDETAAGSFSSVFQRYDKG